MDKFAPASQKSPRRTRLRARVGLAAVILIVAASAAAAAPQPLPAHLQAVRAVATPSAARGLCDRYAWACTADAARTPSGDPVALARAVNRAVNAEVQQVTDRRQFGREDVWDLPTARGGDCEDFVLEKKRRLIEAGLPGSALLIATVLDQRRQGHAVLVLRTRSGDFVLDNLTDRMLPWHRTGYSFLRMQNPAAPRRWDAIAAGGIFGVTASIAGH